MLANDTQNNFDRNYRDLNDQKDSAKNDLSHEANYKLSKIEQDNIDKYRNRGKGDELLDSHSKQIRTPAEKINLKISNRLIAKGMSASLPSTSIDDNNRNWNHHYPKRHLQNRSPHTGRKLLETDESDDNQSDDTEPIPNTVHKLQKALYDIEFLNTLTQENVQDYDIDEEFKNITLTHSHDKGKTKKKQKLKEKQIVADPVDDSTKGNHSTPQKITDAPPTKIPHRHSKINSIKSHINKPNNSNKKAIHLDHVHREANHNPVLKENRRKSSTYPQINVKLELNINNATSQLEVRAKRMKLKAKREASGKQHSTTGLISFF